MAVQQMAAPAGIKLEVKTVPWAVFNSTVYKKKALYVNNWFGRGTIDETLYAYFRTGGGWNEGEFSKPKLDRMLDEGRSTVDMEKRKKHLRRRRSSSSTTRATWSSRYHMNYVTAMRSNVKGYVGPPTALLRLPLDVPGRLGPCEARSPDGRTVRRGERACPSRRR